MIAGIYRVTRNGRSKLVRLSEDDAKRLDAELVSKPKATKRTTAKPTAKPAAKPAPKETEKADSSDEATKSAAKAEA